MQISLFRLLFVLVIAKCAIAQQTNALFMVGSPGENGNLTLLTYDLANGHLMKQAEFPFSLSSSVAACFGKLANGTFFVVHESSVAELDAVNVHLKKVQPLSPQIDSAMGLAYDAKSNSLIAAVQKSSGPSNVTLVSIDSQGTTNTVVDTGYSSILPGLLTLDTTNKVAYYSPQALLVGTNYKTAQTVSSAKYTSLSASLDFYSGRLYSISAEKEAGPFQLMSIDPLTGNGTVVLKFPDNLVVNETLYNPQLTFLDRNRGIHYAFMLQSTTPLMVFTNLSPVSDPIIVPLGSFPAGFVPLAIGALQVRKGGHSLQSPGLYSVDIVYSDF